MSSNRIAVVIATCDKYKDLWGPFFTLFNRFWPDCPYPKYLVTDAPVASPPASCTVLFHDSKSWSTVVKRGLEKISEDYVLLIVDDLFLKRPVQTRRVEQILDWCQKNDAHCIRLRKNPGPDASFQDPTMGKILGVASPETPYRTSTVFT